MMRDAEGGKEYEAPNKLYGLYLGSWNSCTQNMKTQYQSPSEAANLGLAETFLQLDM